MPVNRFVISHKPQEQMLQSIFIIIPMWFFAITLNPKTHAVFDINHNDLDL